MLMSACMILWPQFNKKAAWRRLRFVLTNSILQLDDLEQA